MDGKGHRLPRKQIVRGFGDDFECENPGAPLIMGLQRESQSVSGIRSLGGGGCFSLMSYGAGQ